MSSYGRQIQETTGSPLSVIADGQPEWKHGGITIDWSTVAVVAAETTLNDGTVVAAGDKYLPAGTILDLIGVGEVQTIDLSDDDDPNGGTWSITYDGQTTEALAYNASAAVVEAALEALSNVQPGDIAVTKSSFVYTLTFGNNLGNVSAVTTTDINLSTGGSTVTIAVATSSAGSGSGKYGPADTAASDGRQTLARGETYIMPHSVVMSSHGSDHPPVLEGGLVFQARLQAGNVVNGATQPSLSALLTAMPRLRLVKETA